MRKPKPTIPPLRIGYVRFRASDGSLHDVPLEFLGAARRIDPRLRVVARRDRFSAPEMKRRAQRLIKSSRMPPFPDLLREIKRAALQLEVARRRN
jgi:hypothetical protein